MFIITGKIHITIGVASLALFCVAYPTGFDFMDAKVIPVIGMATAAFGSYLPDIDMQRTHMGSKHKTASKVINKVGGGHRGITHTLLFPALLGLMIWYVGNVLNGYPTLSSIAMSLLFGVEFGYVMHLFADAFNGKGIPLFWPVFKGKVHIMDVPSTGVGAWLFAILLIGVEAFVIFSKGGII